LDLLVKLLEISRVSIIVVGFRDNGLEAGSVVIGFSVCGYSRVVGRCRCCSYSSAGGLGRSSLVFRGNWFLQSEAESAE
jgi:hypothetical protein